MKIKFINLRHLEDFEYDTEIGLSVFIGENGSGKSLLISHIRFVCMLFANKNMSLMNLSNRKISANNNWSGLNVNDIFRCDEGEPFGYYISNGISFFEVGFSVDENQNKICLSRYRAGFDYNNKIMNLFKVFIDNDYESRKLKNEVMKVGVTEGLELSEEGQIESLDDVNEIGREVIGENDYFDGEKGLEKILSESAERTRKVMGRNWREDLSNDRLIYIECCFSPAGYAMIYDTMIKMTKEYESVDYELLNIDDLAHEKEVWSSLVYNGEAFEYYDFTLASLFEDFSNIINELFITKYNSKKKTDEIVISRHFCNESEIVQGNYKYFEASEGAEFYYLHTNVNKNDFKVCELRSEHGRNMLPHHVMFLIRENFKKYYTLWNWERKIGGPKIEIARDFEGLSSSVISADNPLFELFEYYLVYVAEHDNTSFKSRLASICSIDDLLVKRLEEDRNVLCVMAIREGREISLNNLSTGEIHCLIVLLRLLQQKDGIYLNEIDVFLHPNRLSKFIRAIIDLLIEKKSNLKDILIETHSAIVIRELQLMRVESTKYADILNNTRIYYRSKNGDTNREISIKSNGDLSEEIPPGFSDHMTRLNMLRLQLLD